MKDFKFLLEKYLDEKVEIAVHTAKMEQTYSDIIDRIIGGDQLDEVCFNELKGLQKKKLALYVILLSLISIKTQHRPYERFCTWNLKTSFSIGNSVTIVFLELVLRLHL